MSLIPYLVPHTISRMFQVNKLIDKFMDLPPRGGFPYERNQNISRIQVTHVLYRNAHNAGATSTSRLCGGLCTWKLIPEGSDEHTGVQLIAIHERSSSGSTRG